MMMKLFNRWKKSDSKILPHNSKPIFIGKRHGLFDDIVGFEDIKYLFRIAIETDRPVHLLLCGPPASAKSLFMRSLTRLQRSYYSVGSSSTKSGIFDYLFECRPRYFIIDELEKMNKKDQTSLLNLMESGILSELKHNQKRSTQLKTWVFASCNSTATKHSKKMLFAKHILNLPGVSEEEFLIYNNRISDVKFTVQDIERAFLMLKQNGLIKPHLVFENRIRYVMTKDDLLKLIKEISQIFESELILLMFRWRYFEKPTEEEKKRLRWMLGETYAKQMIHSAENAMYENKKALRDSKDINEYCEFLRRDLSGFPTWAVDGQIYMDISRFVDKNKDKKIEAMTKDVHGFLEFRREVQNQLESDLIDGIKDIKKRYENTVQEYAYLFRHVLAMVCPLLLKLPAESYYSDEELEAKMIAAYKLEKKLNPPGFHESIRRHTDERGITDMNKVFGDMKRARTNHKKKRKESKGKT